MTDNRPQLLPNQNYLPGSRWPDRIAGGALMILAVTIIVGALNFHVPYQYEPLGPRFFPYAVGTLLFLAGGLLVLLPQPGALPLESRQYFLFGCLLVYAFAFELLGFFVSTLLVLALATRLAGQPWRTALVGALGISVAAQLLLVLVLQLQLPLGSIWQF